LYENGEGIQGTQNVLIEKINISLYFLYAFKVIEQPTVNASQASFSLENG
jgi:hypothetical protein